MITKAELNLIDPQYFNVLHMSCYLVVLQSHNTGHFWRLECEVHSTFRHYRIYHKHNSFTCYTYHRHRDARNLATAIDHIKSHDSFQINGRQPYSKKALRVQWRSL